MAFARAVSTLSAPGHAARRGCCALNAKCKLTVDDSDWDIRRKRRATYRCYRAQNGPVVNPTTGPLSPLEDYVSAAQACSLGNPASLPASNSTSPVVRFTTR